MSIEKIQITFKDKIINLLFEEFDDSINIDQLTRIDYNNLYTELLTVPALMNRVGIWKAEADDAVQQARLQRDIAKAKLAQLTRANWTGTKKMTIAEMDEVLLLDPQILNMQKVRLRRGKEAAYLDALYWAVKSKEKKLDKIGERMNLVPEEFEKNIIIGKWNGILIQAREQLIRTKKD